VAGARILALAGGVGGAKLVAGLLQAAAPRGDAVTAVINTGDDFEHLGLHIAPDLDSVTYALADLNDRERGWGLRDETWRFMRALERLGGESWFSLGDQDLATHVERTRLLQSGQSLSAVTAHLTQALGIRAEVAPMSDQPVRTFVNTDAGRLAFQHYFVREQCAPRVHGFEFEGANAAKPSHALMNALASSDLAAIVVCPSNPFISIDPMLAIPGVRDALRAAAAPIVAVSPIVGGQAIKGPAAKMLAELGYDVSALGITEHYGQLLDGFVLDEQDATLAGDIVAPTLVTNTMMRSAGDQTALGMKVLNWCRTLQ
jgi:LPPG:FO 2-phospho-L-lactate transferase